ncbi:MAG: hypothetical protein GXX83_09595 [Gaiellales bacterium]|nr:hypothetical protein [Gaiellales bacterium]
MAGRKHFALRIDPTLWDELEAWAQDELRSVNGQIEYILREAVKKRRSRCTPSGSGAVQAPEPRTTRKRNGSA